MERPSVSELINSKKFIIPFIASWFLFTIIGICIIFGGIYGLLTFLDGIPSDYAKASGWDCDQATFETVYYELYMKKIDELEDKYNLSFEKETEWKDENEHLTIYLYDKEYYIEIEVRNCSTHGQLNARIEYYAGMDGISEDFDIIPILDFFTDFVNYAGYDVKNDKQYLEYLYNKLITTNSVSQTYKWHTDDFVSQVGYGVLRKSIKSDCDYKFYFDGLLKPLE